MKQLKNKRNGWNRPMCSHKYASNTATITEQNTNNKTVLLPGDRTMMH